MVRGWLHWLSVPTLFIEPGSPWEHRCCEAFNGKLRDDLLDRGFFFTRPEAQVLIAQWRVPYNRIRPYSALGDRPPAPETRAIPASVSLAPLALGAGAHCKVGGPIRGGGSAAVPTVPV